MAEALEERFPGRVRVTLQSGARGVFDVKADGQLVFSKAREGRFPEAGEVEQSIEARLAA